MPTIPPFSKATKIGLPDVYNYVLKHIDRAKSNSSVNLSAEKIAVGFSINDILELQGAGASDFIAFHGVYNNNHTVILVGVDVEGKLVKDDSNNVIAIERWDKFGPSLKEVDDDLNSLFDIFS